MSIVRSLLAAAALLVSGACIAQAKELPRLQRNGHALQLMVDGAPYLMLSGELHNSSPSSPSYMAPIWDKLQRSHVRTVIGAASWELVEPVEGQFDFAAVDDQIRQAQAHGMKLVLIWFGGYKNAQSTYAPSWVRKDEARFPRAERDPTVKTKGIGAFLASNPSISVFGENLLHADARAFGALMRHIKQIDPNQTVIMMQVENEVGLLSDSRDRSAPAAASWNQPVPPALIDYLRRNRETLNPYLRDVWGRQGFRESGNWAEIFGTDKAADEVFMSWAFGQYVERIAKVGSAEYALPMYTNAWLGPQASAPEPGDYPSGGPVARMIDIWKAATPSLALLAPDIYIEDFAGVLAQYKRPDNAILIPEAKADAGNLFVALGQFDAIGFSPFGIEDVPEDSDLFAAYKVLNAMKGEIAKAQADGRIRGFKIAKGGFQKDSLGGYDFVVSGPVSTVGLFGAGTGSEAQAVKNGYGLVINSGENEFLVVGRGINVQFTKPGARVELDQVEEGTVQAGRWIAGRRMNGDERFFLFPNDGLRIIRFTLLTR
ncbi:MAG TPA: DUF5597 domain-containing protein [Sphingobium sp.]|uniref:GH35 family beta-galactosidase n=1 Tax=Sphingobium sp. TaxID=1912891 RepID=UPI002ED1F7E2